MPGSEDGSHAAELDEHEQASARKVAKGALTRIVNFVAKYDPESQSIEEITVRYKNIEEVWAKYDRAQSFFEQLDFDAHEADREEIETKYYGVKSKMELLMKLAAKAEREQNQSELLNLSVTSQGASPNRSIVSPMPETNRVPTTSTQPASTVNRQATTETIPSASTVNRQATTETIPSASTVNGQATTVTTSSPSAAISQLPIPSLIQSSPSGGSTGTVPSTANTPVSGSVSLASPATESLTDGVNVSQSVSQPKLPTLSIPQFSGIYEQWRGFIELFDAMVHNNHQIPIVQKFFYLKRALTSEPATIVESLATTGDNYEIARELLLDRYENKPIILNAHLKAIFDIPNISKESTAALRKLTNTTKQHLRAVAALNCPIENWDPIIIFIIKQKLDQSSKRQWELENRSPRQLPTLEQFYQFLDQRCFALEALQTFHQCDDKSKTKQPITRVSSHVVSGGKGLATCPLCEGSHLLMQCPGFNQKRVSERVDFVKAKSLCFNCLKSGHSCQKCTSRHCTKCSRYHHTLLHREGSGTGNTSTAQVMTTATESESVHNNFCMNSITGTYPTQVLLATAIVNIEDEKGIVHACRALLDSGSQAHFITSSLMKKLGCNPKPLRMPVIGINQSETKVTQMVEVVFSSRVRSFRSTIMCLVIPKITGNLPSCNVEHQSWNLPEVELADPNFFKHNEVDLLIGAELYFDILRTEKIKLGPGLPVLQDTLLGWIVSGKIGKQPYGPSLAYNVVCNLSATEIQNDIERFWNMEELVGKQHLTEEERKCEEHFVATFKRDESGRFQLQLPFKEEPHVLGESKHAAIQRLFAMERRMSRDAEFKEQYTKFMKEYESLGHMSSVPGKEQCDRYVYLPHHGVVREESSTTKLRVVFDGSSKTTSGVSLNGILMVGPKIQSELFDIILRFREHKYVVTADVEKMFRQIEIQEQDRRYQCILWRVSQEDPIGIYKLNTVTYGLASSPYHAVRCLKQLAVENAALFPETSRIIKEDFYMDDLLTGANSLEEVTLRRKEIIQVLESADLKLRKWRANDDSLITELKENDELQISKLKTLEFVFDTSSVAKTLGILWDSDRDVIKYNSIDQKEDVCITKRQLLSQIAKLFDPLGLIQPIVMLAKQLMQDLWKLKSDWDYPVPILILEEWNAIKEQLPLITILEIPRCGLVAGSELELHVFADASEKGYGAVVYIRSIVGNYSFQVRLICSKSRVAPLKTVSLPRLELCAAVLAARLLTAVNGALRRPIPRVYCWTDSEITLHWINTEPYKLKTFVANRVSEIQTLTSKSTWRHVNTKDNPADFVSRGLLPRQLLEAEKWWSGPSFLLQPESSWSMKTSPGNISSSDLELKGPIIATVTAPKSKCEELARFSSWIKLVRFVARCIRFIHNFRHKQAKRFGALSVEELQTAKNVIIMLIQQEDFGDELMALRHDHQIDKNSKILSLNPFCDENRILRVGGRLRNSDLDPDRRHPILLPANHHVTKIIMREKHHQMLHCGPDQLLAVIRLIYWPIGGRSLARQVTKQCKTCARYNPKPMNYLMGDLPKERVLSCLRPFSVTGIDYAGPIQIRESHRRGRIPVSKAYIAVFVCFSTKAVHLELVSSLTTVGFLSALKRFIGRRGICQKIFSDNATNFTGANAHLKDIYKLIKDSEEEITNYLSVWKIEWSFIPPRAPHFGGLWEAAVRSFKRHFYKVAKSALFTYEECNTLIIQIEAVLNSRPLQPLSTDPNDLTVLTPAHFLIGDSLIEPPELSFSNVPDNRLSRFEMLQKIRAHFWQRWQREYIQTLQLRRKWRLSTPNVQVGDLVLIIDDNLRPLQWPMGRITQLHPGQDGVVRVASVKTVNGIFKRAIKRLCKLSNEEDKLPPKSDE